MIIKSIVRVKTFSYKAMEMQSQNSLLRHTSSVDLSEERTIISLIKAKLENFMNRI